MSIPDDSSSNGERGSCCPWMKFAFQPRYLRFSILAHSLYWPQATSGTTNSPQPMVRNGAVSSETRHTVSNCCTKPITRRVVLVFPIHGVSPFMCICVYCAWINTPWPLGTYGCNPEDQGARQTCYVGIEHCPGRGSRPKLLAFRHTSR